DLSTRVLRYCCAGHPPVLRLAPGREPEELSLGGPLLGVIEDAEFETHEVQLDVGDRILFYSDGIDAVHWGDQGRGRAGLVNSLSGRDGRSPQGLIDD